MIDKDNSKVNWNQHSLLMFAYLKQKPGAFDIFKTIARPVDGTDEEKASVTNLNNWCYSVLVESCKLNTTAMQQAQELFNPDGSDTWATICGKV